MQLSTLARDEVEILKQLLQKAGLPTSGIRAIQDEFIIMRDSTRVVGAIAVEPFGNDALLRSLVVHPDYRGRGIGQQLVSTLLENTNKNLYLLTETAEHFFVRFGFESVSRKEAPEAIKQSEEFQDLCPESACFMRRTVQPSPQQ